MAAKKVKSFRFSEETQRRLAKLALHEELSQTAYLEQLIKRDYEIKFKKARVLNFRV